MACKAEKARQKLADAEIGTIHKDWKGRITVALVYPNSYHVGMSNLGFQTVYDLLNRIEHVVCERSFLPDENTPQAGRIVTVESGRPLGDFDIIAFSVSFENDYPHLLTILEKAGLPLRASDRAPLHPLVIAGGSLFFRIRNRLPNLSIVFSWGKPKPCFPVFLIRFPPTCSKQTEKRAFKPWPAMCRVFMCRHATAPSTIRTEPCTPLSRAATCRSRSNAGWPGIFPAFPPAAPL
ncbi:MAG: hypothetical protein KKH68_13105 [Proteobacteria bacterium]|nr:hypothetical protein [Pseudomonadota bacterium]